MLHRGDHSERARLGAASLYILSVNQDFNVAKAWRNLIVLTVNYPDTEDRASNTEVLKADADGIVMAKILGLQGQ